MLSQVIPPFCSCSPANKTRVILLNDDCFLDYSRLIHLHALLYKTKHRYVLFFH